MNVYTLGKNQSLVVEDGEETFFSYGTEIAKRSRSGIVTLTSSWNASRTTTKWLCRFLGISNKELKDKVNSKEFTIISF